MKTKYPIALAIVLLITLVISSCLVLPTISESHLLSDIRENELSISVGTEQILGETSIFLPDILYEYISFAPADWFEFGLAGHYSVAFLGIDARIDFIDMFTDNNPLSAMLLGGVLFFSGGSGPVVHFGTAANYRINSFVELYACAATSTLFFVPSFHVGTNVRVFDWLSLSANLKMVLNLLETNANYPPAAFMVSIAPKVSFGF